MAEKQQENAMFFAFMYKKAAIQADGCPSNADLIKLFR
jgi:hypothetical protein